MVAKTGIGNTDFNNSFVDDNNGNVAINALAQTANSLIDKPHDQIILTYVASGNGVGKLETATYKLASATVYTVTLTYNATHKLIDVTRT